MNKSEYNIILNGNGNTSANNMNQQQQLFPGVTLRSVSTQRDSHIPVPRAVNSAVSSPAKFTDRMTGFRATSNNQQQQQQQHQLSSHPPLGKSMSVAAQRAAFEKLDAVAGATTSSNGISSVSASCSSPVKFIQRANSNGSQTEIPSPLACRSPRLDRSNSFQEASRWKAKYEDVEKRRKMLLQKSEAVSRENADLEKKYQQILRQNGTLQSQLQDKSDKLDKMRTVSEAVCKEYEQLKRQYHVETGAMHKAMQQASQVIMIFGIMGCCRVDEMTKIRVNDIKEEGKVLVVNVPQENAKNNKARQFFINADMTTIVKRYIRLRPKDMPTDRFFINYQKGVCTKQPIGKNKIHTIPKTIARWLGLEDPTAYSGLAIRHTSDTYNTNSEHGSTIVMKRYGGLHSDKLAEGYRDLPFEKDVKPDISALSLHLNENSIYDDESFACTDSMVDPLGDWNEVEEKPKCSSPPLKRRRIDGAETSRTSRSSSPQQTDDTQDSSWYRQNRELKRRSQVITQKYLQSNPDALNDFDLQDEVDNHADDIEQLRETVTELSQEVAKLQTELNAARLQEFEAQEQVTLLTSQLEEERTARQNDEEKLREIKVQKENMERVTKMVADEVQTLKTQCDRERENARLAKVEADKIQKERNVLAHQSALLMVDVGNDPSGRLLVVLQEVETLKRMLEEEKQSYAAQLQTLQEKLEEKESNVEFEIVEEKLKLSESELEMVVQRAERAEKTAEAMQEKVRELEAKIAELEKKASAPPPPPLPPPPPPPPPMPTTSANGSSSIKLITRERLSGEANNSALENMESMLGINKKSPPLPQQPVIDDIINQIKGGRFTLKQTNKQREEKRKRKEEEEAKPPAVSEMLNILGTMRRRAKPTRSSFKFANGSS